MFRFLQWKFLNYDQNIFERNTELGRHAVTCCTFMCTEGKEINPPLNRAEYKIVT